MKLGAENEGEPGDALEIDLPTPLKLRMSVRCGPAA